MYTNEDYSNYSYEDLYDALDTADQLCSEYWDAKDKQNYEIWYNIWVEILNEIERREELYK